MSLTYKLCFFVLALAVSACDTGSGGTGGATLTASGLLVGESVALDDDAAVLGAPGSNEAFVFARGSGGWNVNSTFRPSDARGTDPYYGQILDLDAGVAVVGAPEYDDSSDAAGHAYVYERSGGEWTETAVLRPDDLDPNAKFGGAVAASGRRIAVGASDGGGAGEVHVFEGVGGSWTRSAVLTHPDPDRGSAFGIGVALDGDRLAVVGSRPTSSDGRVYVYERTGPGSWLPTAVIESPPPPPGSLPPLGFGRDVALDGPTLVVNESGQGAGSVHVYRLSSGAWSLEATLTRTREETGPLSVFGNRLALSGSRLVAAAPGRLVDGKNRGAVFVYKRGPDGVWTEEAELTGPVFGFGRDVAIDGETVLVGANDTESRGGGYLFTRGPDGWVPVR